MAILNFVLAQPVLAKLFPKFQIMATMNVNFLPKQSLTILRLGTKNVFSTLRASIAKFHHHIDVSSLHIALTM